VGTRAGMDLVVKRKIPSLLLLGRS